ncbi:9630041A04Rik [Phodopus roborovskii]|uniref:9630041A04Rik protein n=1 Tax=Phodopus roborovskii TaxID=109678 RepID=A0AAU9YSP9_PHORO|nr:9630041A04Rik [Phodopus roborovskii]
MWWHVLVKPILESGICLGLMAGQPSLLEDADQPHEGPKKRKRMTLAGRVYRQESFCLKVLYAHPALNSQWKQRLLAVELQLNLCNKEALPRNARNLQVSPPLERVHPAPLLPSF